MSKYSLIILFVLSFFSCAKKSNYVPPFYETEYTEINDIDSNDENTESLTTENTICVPFEERNGVKYLEVKLNDTFTIPMILDSGCSGTLISVAEAQHLYSKGVLTEDDFLGTARQVIADGSVVENMVVNLRQIVIGGKITCPNVEAIVSSNTQAPLLLGNEVLNRTASYTIDNQSHTINFKMK